MTNLPTIRLLFASTMIAIVGFCCPDLLNAQSLPDRPDTRYLLPETTVALIKVRNFRELAEKMSNSSLGQMMQSESVGPLVSGLYDSAARQYERVEEQVEFSLEEIRSLPEGEITIAVIAPRRKDLAYVVMMETDEDNEVVERILDKGRSLLEDEDQTTEESELEIEVETVVIDGTTVYFANYEGMLIGSSSREEFDAIFTRWSGGEVPKVRALAENRKFATIAGRCAVSDETPPDIRFFADPIEIFKASARGNAGMTFAVALLPTLGLDGLLGAGGNVFIDYENYESIAHGHLLMASPRNGVLNAFSLKPSDYTPEPWVPEEISSYASTSWDVPQMLDSIKTITDKIAGEGTFDEAFLSLQNQMEDREIDLDPRTDLIDLMTGRITFVRAILSGTEINGISNIISLGLDDVEAFEETLIKISSVAEVSRWMSEKEYEGTRYWSLSEEAVERRTERREAAQERRRKRREDAGRPAPPTRLEFRENEPCIGVIGESFVLADSVESFEAAVDTFLGNRDSLSEGEAFKDHMASLTRLLGTELPAALFFTDSPREFEFYLKAFGSENVKEVIASRAEQDDSGFLSDVKASIDEHGFPNFEDIKKYLTVTGGFVTTDDSGYHFLFFQEKPEE